MASHVRTITRTVVTRPAADIDPKIAGVFAVAAATIAIVAAAVIATVLLGQQIDLAAIAGPIVPVLIAAGVGYVRKSAHRELIEDGVHAAEDLVDVAAPIFDQVAPEAATVVDEIHDGVHQLEAALNEPTDA